jgi:hypothetical protein
MTANTAPIYTLTPHVGWGATTLTTANVALDGTGTVLGCFTAGASGSYIQRIRFRAAGTNIATVGRVFINNGSTNATAANNTFWDEISLAATTANAAAALQTFELPLNFAIPAGYVLNTTLGTTVAGGYAVTVIGGDY